MYDSLFPEYNDSFKIVVALIDGKVVGSCSIYIEEVSEGVKKANINTILINPN